MTNWKAQAEALAEALEMIKRRTAHHDEDTLEDDSRDKRHAHHIATAALTTFHKAKEEE
jgi:uncharacterized protein YukE